MSSLSRDPSSLATTSLACPLCAVIYLGRKDLLYHLRTSTNEPYKTFRYDACAPAIAYRLLILGVLPCPLACGALFD